MERTTTSPDEVIAGMPDEIRADVTALDRLIQDVMRGHERVLWEGVFWGGSRQRIIGYGRHRSVRRSGPAVEWFIVGLARQKAYLSLYVNATEGGAYIVKRYADRLGKVKVGSANVTFKRVADIDLDVMREMVERARNLSGDPQM